MRENHKLCEDNICEAISKDFTSRGFATRYNRGNERGIDIVAINYCSSEKWVIEAKGCTHAENKSKVETEKVSQAFFMAASWVNQKKFQGFRIGIAIPRSPYFDCQSSKIQECCKQIGITIFRVNELHEVHVVDLPVAEIKGEVTLPLN